MPLPELPDVSKLRGPKHIRARVQAFVDRIRANENARTAKLAKQQEPATTPEGTPARVFTG